ncbi:MAG: DUF3102 domain-containing protein [Alphaproteobacteria bacterium]|nr:DUF3102 domain-containing protein [Alphaproteobacteria bacterium]
MSDDYDRLPVSADWTHDEILKASDIAMDFRRGVEFLVNCGEKLINAKAAMEHGRFERWIDECLPFGPRTGRQFMQIAGDINIRRHVEKAKTESDSVLPPEKTTLLELVGMNSVEFEGYVKDGVIHPEMKRGDIKRAQVAAAHADPAVEAAPLPEGRHGAILADPPWRFQAFGAGGTDRSPENHYPTMKTDEIAALPVGDLAAQDCALFLWTTSAMLLDALTVMQSWGFQYRSTAFVWMKEGGFGLGYWTRKDAEICLLGIKGSPKRLNADVREGILTKRGKHSEKPAEVYRRIERLVPGPYMELFARKAHLGWNRWGNDPALAVKPAIREPVDGDGPVIPPGEVDEELEMPCKKGEVCRIQLHRDRRSGRWMWGISMQFPHDTQGFGHGYQVGPKWGKFAEDRASALHWAFDELVKQVERHDSDLGRKILKRVAKWREDLK